MQDCMALCLSTRTKIKVKTRGDDAEQQNNEGEIFFCEVGVPLVWLQQACVARRQENNTKRGKKSCVGD